MASAYEVGKKLVELCQKGDFMGAINSLYADDIVSVEAMAGPNMPARIQGIDAVRGKGEWWMANHDVHGCEVIGPFPHGDRFIVRFVMDVTAKVGPMAGRRMKHGEAALYTVTDGKITQEEFFYAME